MRKGRNKNTAFHMYSPRFMSRAFVAVPGTNYHVSPVRQSALVKPQILANIAAMERSRQIDRMVNRAMAQHAFQAERDDMLDVLERLNV
jgi:hypothetical protein